MHFGRDDLARVRVAKGPDPMWELVLSTQVLLTKAGGPVFGRWREVARRRLRRLARSQARLVRQLVPPVGDFPDFLTPPQTDPSLAAGIEAVLGTPAAQLRRDLAVLRKAPSWLRPLADGEPVAVGAVADAIRAHYDAVLAPVWGRIQNLVAAERAGRSRAVLDHGTDGVLAGLSPALRWRAPVLEAEYPVDRDHRLGGRGVLLVPSMFCWRTPVTFIDPELPPVLVDPVPKQVSWWTPAAGTGGAEPLARLLGRTRAGVLRAVESGCSTNEVAHRVGVSAPTASEHASALREAGLLASVRNGTGVIHTATPLGTALLQANSYGCSSR
jgi:DNA-binding transcriptional ArsR family regulator